MALSLSTARLTLALKHPFKIARGESRVAESVLIRVRDEAHEGIGEATPIARYGESAESVVAYFQSHPLTAADPFRLEDLLQSDIPPAARAGLDIALHDLISKRLGAPLYTLLGLDPAKTPRTSLHSASPIQKPRCVSSPRLAPIRFSK